MMLNFKTIMCFGDAMTVELCVSSHSKKQDQMKTELKNFLVFI